MASDISIRYAATDADIIATHRFLCVLAIQNKMLPGPIDHKDSAVEVWKVATESVILMAMRGDMLMGTLGLIQVPFWWNHRVRFFVNRWLFVVPGSGACAPLIRDAVAIAKASGHELYIIDEAKSRLKIFNKQART